MGKRRIFTTLPVRAMGDASLSALDLRVMAAVSLHDGMSLVNGRGAGCFAKLGTLAEMVGTDMSNLSKSLSRLVELGYVLRERQDGDRRRFTHRVIFGDEDSWRNDQQNGRTNDTEKVGDFANNHGAEIVGETTNNLDGEKVGDFTNNQPKKVGQITNYPEEIVGEITNYCDTVFASDDQARYSNYMENSHPERAREGADYIPLNGELNSVETVGLNSAEAAQLADRELPCGQFDWSKKASGKSHQNTRKNDAEASAASEEIIIPLLPRNFARLPRGAMVARIEEAFSAIGRDLGRLSVSERSAICTILTAIVGEADGESDSRVAGQAQRLWEELYESGEVQ